MFSWINKIQLIFRQNRIKTRKPLNRCERLKTRRLGMCWFKISHNVDKCMLRWMLIKSCMNNYLRLNASGFLSYFVLTHRKFDYYPILFTSRLECQHRWGKTFRGKAFLACCVTSVEILARLKNYFSSSENVFSQEGGTLVLHLCS